MGLITSATQTAHDGARAVTQHLESEGRLKVQGPPQLPTPSQERDTELHYIHNHLSLFR